MTVLKALVPLALCVALSSFDATGAQSSVNVTPVGSSLQLPATLIRPDGDGPFAAVVVMHDCSGLGPRSSGAPMRWAAELVQQGYVVLIPDSFTPRGFPNGVCTTPVTLSASANGYARAADAYGALATLRALAYVDAKRIGLLGNSHGGWTTLAANSAALHGDDVLGEARRDGFRAAVALYPSCAPRFGAWYTRRAPGQRVGPVASYHGTYQPVAPLLILAGEKDDWTPAEPCRRLADTSRAAGYPVEIKIYPDAHHAFDNDRPVRYDERRNSVWSVSGKGATTGGDPAAWADARKQIAEFFALHLRP